MKAPGIAGPIGECMAGETSRQQPVKPAALVDVSHQWCSWFMLLFSWFFITLNNRDKLDVINDIMRFEHSDRWSTSNINKDIKSKCNKRYVLRCADKFNGEPQVFQINNYIKKKNIIFEVFLLNVTWKTNITLYFF